MLITVLSVPECPNVAALIDRVQQVSGRVIGPEVVVIVEDEQQAQAWAMPGSPTLLLNGQDPFGAGVGASLSCRLYLDPNGGGPAGVPNLDRLRVALEEAAQKPAPADASCLDPVSRAGSGRAAPLEGGLRTVQQTVLSSISLAGTLPDSTALDRAAAPFGRPGANVLSALAEQDFLSLDESGRVRAAYPFSLAPTYHRVRISGGATVWAMCAIDALGIAPMLGRDTLIESTDPLTEERVRVASTAGQLDWAPSSAVVFAGRRGGSGPAELTCCSLINFFASEHSATRWAALHTDVAGVMLNQTRAAELGREIFGHLLNGMPRSPDPTPEPLT